MAKKEIPAKKKGTKKICLGDTANFFHDPYTNTAIAKGEVKELEPRVLNAKRVRTALASGHLQVFTGDGDEADPAELGAEAVEKLVKKITALHKSGKDVAKTAEAFDMDGLVNIAETFDMEKEEGDTKETLVAAIFEKLEAKKD